MIYHYNNSYGGTKMFGFSKGLIAMALAAFLVVGGGAVGTAAYVNQE